MPKHGSPSVNDVECFIDESLIKDVFDLKTPLAVVYDKLVEAELMKEVHDKCVVCLSEPNQCVEFKACLQHLMDCHTPKLSLLFHFHLTFGFKVHLHS